MSGWQTHTGRACVLRQDNIDTDQLIPARFMSAPRSAGYGGFLLHDARHAEDGTPTDHPLNSAQPSVLIAGRNFGSGSSREAAVYALVDFGIRAVFAPSFGDIFASNAVNNGLLPARVSSETHAALLAQNGQDLTLDLEAATVAGRPFEIDPVWQTKLINGWDDIDLTQTHSATIAAFTSERKTHAGWSWPAQQTTPQQGETS